MKKISSIVLLIVAFVSFYSCVKKEEPKVMGSLYGSVTDKATGEPVKYAKIEIMQTGLSIRTGDDGNFEFPQIEAGKYNLYVTKSGYTEYKTTDIIINEDNKDKPVHILLDKLPPALQIVDDSRHEIDSIAFGYVEGDEMRSFNIFNNSDDALEWEIVYKTDSWIKSLSKDAGNLAAGKSQAIVVTIDRTKLYPGYNSTVVHIVSNNGSKQLTVTAVSVSLLETLAITEITPTSAVLNGKFNKKSGSAIEEYGFVYGVMPTPSLDNGAVKVVVKGMAQIGNYSYAISGLTNGETYFVRAFAKTENEEFYGETQSFIAQEVPYVTLISASLMVQKEDLGYVDWYSAKTMCEYSIVGGYTDWRMPNTEELMILYNNRETIGGFDGHEIPNWHGTDSCYWSSQTRTGAGWTFGYLIDFSNGRVGDDFIAGTQSTGTHNVRAVRTMQ